MSSESKIGRSASRSGVRDLFGAGGVEGATSRELEKNVRISFPFGFGLNLCIKPLATFLLLRVLNTIAILRHILGFRRRAARVVSEDGVGVGDCLHELIPP